MQLAQRLADRVAMEPELELFDHPSTGVVLWRPTRVSARTVLDNLTDATVATTNVSGETWLRSVAANPNADPDGVVDEVLAVVAQH